MSDKDDIIAAIRDGFANVNNTTRSANVQAPSQIAGRDTFTDKLAAGIDKTTTGLGALAGGTANAGDVITATSGFIGKFGLAGRAAGDMLNEVGTGAYNVNRALNETGKYGVTFGQNLGDANLAIKDARLTVPEFTQVIQQSGKAFAGAAAGQNASAKVFLSTLTEIQNTTAGQQLQSMGVQSMEFSDALVTVSGSMVNVYGDQAAYTAKVKEATLGYLHELTAVSEMTGKSRKEQEAANKKVMESAEIEAAVLRQMKVDPEFGNKMTAATAAMGNFGEPAQNMLKEMVTGGVRTKEGLAQAASYGPEVQEKMRAYADALKNGNATQIAEAEKATKVAIAKRLQDEDFQKQTELQGSNLLAHGAVMKGGYEYEKNIIAAQAELKKKGLASDEAAAMDFIAQNKAKKDAGLNEKGEKDSGAVVGRSINQVEQLGKVAGSVIAGGFKTLNDTIGNTVTTSFPQLDAAIKTISTRAGMTTATKNEVSNVVNEANKLIGVKGAAPTPGGVLPPTSTIKRLNGSPGIPDFLNGGDFNKMFEQFGSGTPIEVHGEEMIARKDQMGQIMKKMQGQISGNMPNMNNIAQQVQNQVGPELTSMMNNIKTKVSSANTDSQGQQTPKLAATTQPMPATNGSASINDLKDQLIQLNKGIMQLISYSAETVNLNEKQVRAIKGSSNNRYA